MKKLFCLIFPVLLILLSLPGCAGKGDPAGSTDEGTVTQTESLSEVPAEQETPEMTQQPLDTEIKSRTLTVAEHTADLIQPLGRTYVSGRELCCEATCTGISFGAYCSGDITLTLNVSALTYFTVYVDGTVMEYAGSGARLKVTASDRSVTLASGLPEGKHTVRVVKQSQFTMSSARLGQISLYGYFLERTQQARFIEFYGDSILNGSNVLGDGTTSTSVDTSDGTHAFGWLTAEALGADCNIVGCGGLGVSVASATQNGRAFVMNDVYNKCGGLTAPAYDFARRPDVVVIELGVNDCVRASQTTVENFQAAVRELVNNIRSKYGEDIPIVWVCGYLGNTVTWWLNVKAVLATMGDNLYTCRVTPFTEKADTYHPQTTSAAKMAEDVAAFLNKTFYQVEG